ncbi:MAG: hypothetical protein O7C02_01800, partial [Rickettsia endosymbiont of Ixodes persulcatus]|nr:hypothetical protein [Rickettsia endosymbiont of Ixodes persulcatus]
KESDVNTSYFGSNLLSLAAGLEEPHKTDIICYLLIKGAIPLNTISEATKTFLDTSQLCCEECHL